jgi:thiol:disulfide interchange protein
VSHRIHDADIEVELAKKYRVRCVPVYVVVDPNGEVKFNDVGMLTESELEEILHRAGLGAH